MLGSRNCNTTNLLNEPTEYSPSWEAKRSLASQEIPCILRNPEKHCCLHRNPPLLLIPSQINTVLAFPNNCFEVHSNIIFPSKPRSSKWSLSLRFSHQHPTCTSPLSHTWWNTNVKAKTKRASVEGPGLSNYKLPTHTPKTALSTRRTLKRTLCAIDMVLYLHLFALTNEVLHA